MKDFNPVPKDIRFDTFFGSITSFVENNIVYKNIASDLTFEQDRLDEYRSALTGCYLRFGKTVAFLGWNTLTNEANLMKPNTVFEALVHFIDNKFTWSISSNTPELFFDNLSRPDQRRFCDVIIQIEVLQYQDIIIKNYVTEILQNLKS